MHKIIIIKVKYKKGIKKQFKYKQLPGIAVKPKLQKEWNR